MKYNINNVEELLDTDNVEKFPTKKGPRKMKKHQDTEDKKKERHARRNIKEQTFEMVLSEKDDD